MILDLLVGGGRVGVTANSHKVISNLLAAVCDAADEPPVENGQAGGESAARPGRQAPVDIRGIQKANDGDGLLRRTHPPRPAPTTRWPRHSPPARRTSPQAPRGCGRARRWPAPWTSSTRRDR